MVKSKCVGTIGIKGVLLTDSFKKNKKHLSAMESLKNCVQDNLATPSLINISIGLFFFLRRACDVKISININRALCFLGISSYRMRKSGNTLEASQERENDGPPASLFSSQNSSFSKRNGIRAKIGD